MASAPPPRDEAPGAEPRRPEEEDGRGSAALEAELQRAGGRSGGSSLRPGHVYFVATPIGNLDDLTLRAARTLREADYVASEDTRHTAKLLRHLGVSPAKQLSHHEHNALAASARIIALATEGATVAVVSDAGTPGISDPGAVLAERCAAAGVPLVPIPGACAAVSALSVSGFACTGFRFGGFLPRSGRARKQRLAELVADPNAVVLYEAPHRLVATLSELAAAGAGDRRLVAARELTKLHEELARGSVGGLAAHFGALELQGKLRGEFTLVMAPISEDELQERANDAREETQARARSLLGPRLEAGEPLSQLVRDVAAELGARKRPIYELALEMQGEMRGAGPQAESGSTEKWT